MKWKFVVGLLLLIGVSIALFVYVEREPQMIVPSYTYYYEAAPYYLSVDITIEDATKKTKEITDVTIGSTKIDEVFVIDATDQKFPQAWENSEKSFLPFSIVEGEKYEIIVKTTDPQFVESIENGFIIYFNDYHFENKSE